MSRRYVIVVMAILGVFFIGAGEERPAYALSCAEPPSVNDEYERSELVFKGKVVGKSKKETGTFAQLEMQHIWKGTPSATVELFENDMWLAYETGHDYLIYAAHNEKGSLHAHLCGRTGKWEKAQADAALFGHEGTALSSEKGTEESLFVGDNMLRESLGLITPLGAAVAALLFLTPMLVALIIRRRKKK